ncbi:MAG: hypothetical protein M1376_09860, partial [Planctomycetes bacterium]|nr:hypothetical protein [Planctomycetota bacterium]
GPAVMFGAMPVSKTLAERNAVFNRTGQMLQEAFTFAHLLGVQTCVGTETPLTIPNVVKERLIRQGKDPNNTAVVREVYEGMFARIARAYPLDYYWFWTPESWTWGNPKDREVQATIDDLNAAIEAARNVKSPLPRDRSIFTLAT